MATGVLQRGDGTALVAQHLPLLPRAMMAKKKASRETRRVLPHFVVPNHAVPMTPYQRAVLHETYNYTTSGLRKAADDVVVAKAVEVLKAGADQAETNPKKQSVSG